MRRGASFADTALTTGRLLISAYASLQTRWRFPDREFAQQLCTEGKHRQEFTTLDTPNLNGTVERGLGLVRGVEHAAFLEAQRLFTDVQLPSSGHRGPRPDFGFGACEMFDIFGNDHEPRNLLAA